MSYRELLTIFLNCDTRTGVLSSFPAYENLLKRSTPGMTLIAKREPDS